MDPNATLEALRVWAASVLSDASAGYSEIGDGYSEVGAAESFQALDEWLSGGRFPPKEWEYWARRGDWASPASPASPAILWA